MTPQSPHHDSPTAHGDRTDDRQGATREASG